MHLELVYRPNIKIQRPGSEVLSVNSWIPSAADLERSKDREERTQIVCWRSHFTSNELSL